MQDRPLGIAGGFFGCRGFGGFSGFAGGGCSGCCGCSGGAGGEFADAAVDEADVLALVHLLFVAVDVVDTAVGMDRGMIGKGNIARYRRSGAVHDLGELAVFFHDINAAVALRRGGGYCADNHDYRRGEEEG